MNSQGVTYEVVSRFKMTHPLIEMVCAKLAKGNYGKRDTTTGIFSIDIPLMTHPSIVEAYSHQNRTDWLRNKIHEYIMAELLTTGLNEGAPTKNRYRWKFASIEYDLLQKIDIWLLQGRNRIGVDLTTNTQKINTSSTVVCVHDTLVHTIYDRLAHDDIHIVDDEAFHEWLSEMIQSGEIRIPQSFLKIYNHLGWFVF